MSHNLSDVFIAHSSEEFKASLLSNGFFFQEHNGFLIITDNILEYETTKKPYSEPEPRFSKVAQDHGLESYVILETSYFGGHGEQSAKFVHLKSPQMSFEDYKNNSINKALFFLGVSVLAPHIDEFDTIHLGKYRNNQDIISEEYIQAHKEQLDIIELEKYLLWKDNFESLSQKDQMRKIFELATSYKQESIFGRKKYTYSDDSNDNHDFYNHLEKYLQQS